jgi:hypothetical protein
MTHKEIVLSILLLGSGFLTGLVWEKIPDNPYFALVVLLYAVAFGFFLLLVEHKLLLWLVPTISLALVAWFLVYSQFTLLGLGAAIVVVVFAVRQSKVVYKSSCKFSLNRILSKGMKLFFTSLALLFAFAYYGDIKDHPNTVSLLLPENVFNVTLKLLEVPLQGVIPGISAEGTVDDVASQAQREQLSKQLGVSLNGDDKISNALYQLSISRIANVTEPFGAYIPAIVSASYFFALKFVSIIFYYASLLLIFLLIQVFLAMGLLKKVIVPTEKEILI